MFYLINKLRFMLLFFLLILFCLFKAITAQFYWTDPPEIIFAVLIGSCLLVIGHKEKLLLILVAALIVIQIVFLGLHYCCSKQLIYVLRTILVIIYLIVQNYFCLYVTLKDQTISPITLFGSLSGYLFIGLTFAYIFLLVELLSPTSFSGLITKHESQAIYFSFITLTTVGYGEIVPLKPIAQTFTWFESLIGQFYLAVIIGQMVGRFVAKKESKM